MCVNKIGAPMTGSEQVNKIVPGEQNRSKYEQNRGCTRLKQLPTFQNTNTCPLSS